MEVFILAVGKRILLLVQEHCFFQTGVIIKVITYQDQFKVESCVIQMVQNSKVLLMDLL